MVEEVEVEFFFVSFSPFRSSPITFNSSSLSSFALFSLAREGGHNNKHPAPPEISPSLASSSPSDLKWWPSGCRAPAGCHRWRFVRRHLLRQSRRRRRRRRSFAGSLALPLLLLSAARQPAPPLLCLVTVTKVCADWRKKKQRKEKIDFPLSCVSSSIASRRASNFFSLLATAVDGRKFGFTQKKPFLSLLPFLLPFPNHPTAPSRGSVSRGAASAAAAAQSVSV